MRQQHYKAMLSLFGTYDQICVYQSIFAGNGCLWGLMSASHTQCYFCKWAVKPNNALEEAKKLSRAAELGNNLGTTTPPISHYSG